MEVPIWFWWFLSYPRDPITGLQFHVIAADSNTIQSIRIGIGRYFEPWYRPSHLPNMCDSRLYLRTYNFLIPKLDINQEIMIPKRNLLHKKHDLHIACPSVYTHIYWCSYKKEAIQRQNGKNEKCIWSNLGIPIGTWVKMILKFQPTKQWNGRIWKLLVQSTQLSMFRMKASTIYKTNVWHNYPSRIQDYPQENWISFLFFMCVLLTIKNMLTTSSNRT